MGSTRTKTDVRNLQASSISSNVEYRGMFAIRGRIFDVTMATANKKYENSLKITRELFVISLYTLGVVTGTFRFCMTGSGRRP